MEQLKTMLNQLKACVGAQMGNLAEANTKELGEAVDMIKDLEEAMYYCSIVKAMEKREEEEKKEEKEGKSREHHHYYTEKYIPYPDPYMMDGDYRDMDRDRGRMYYPHRNARGQFSTNGTHHYYTDGMNPGSGSSNRGNAGSGMNGGYSGNSGSHGFHEEGYPMEMRDHREGQSPIRRKYYMESKELHKDKKTQMEELEKYMQELSKDITEMIGEASPEETTLLKQKLVTLIEKIK